jgi:DNA (cytosine-5)-methyltransferase 1
MSRNPIVAVDLFCGVAGLSLGLKRSGISIAAGVDVDPDCRFPFVRNIGAPFLQKDVTSISSAEIAALFPPNSVRLLAGCAPCQPFSAYTTKRREVDDRWRLLLEFLRLVKEIHPEIVTFENVLDWPFCHCGPIL